jgi:hypothetical protein
VGTEQILVLVLVAGLAGSGLAIQLQHARASRHARQQLFDQVTDVVDRGRLEGDGTGYPVLTGEYLGHPLRLAAVVDSLTLRKLPALWLILTLSRPLPMAAPVDVLARPSGSEFFSPNSRYPHQLPVPPGFPVHARIATPRPTPVPAELLRAIGGLMADPKVKEVYAGPAGLRIVYQLAEAASGPYRTTRQADFGSPQLTEGTLTRLLDAMGELPHALGATEVRPS